VGEPLQTQLLSGAAAGFGAAVGVQHDAVTGLELFTADDDRRKEVAAQIGSPVHRWRSARTAVARSVPTASSTA
jgi:hypothetical protein